MPHVAARTASRDEDAGRYQRHRPEHTLLYQLGDALLSGEFAPTVVIATHSFELARRFNRVLWLQDGGMSELEGAELTRGLMLAGGIGSGASQGLKAAET